MFVARPSPLSALRIGLLAPSGVSAQVADIFARITAAVAGVGGTVVVPQNQSALLTSPGYLKKVPTYDSFSSVTACSAHQVVAHQLVDASLNYGQRPASGGFHIMQTPTRHYVETLTGLGATGVEIIVVHVENQVGSLVIEHSKTLEKICEFSSPQSPMQTHPMIPVLQLTTSMNAHDLSDFDLIVTPESNARDVMQLILGTSSLLAVPARSSLICARRHGLSCIPSQTVWKECRFSDHQRIAWYLLVSDPLAVGWLVSGDFCHPPYVIVDSNTVRRMYYLFQTVYESKKKQDQRICSVKAGLAWKFSETRSAINFI
jgi:hypothetical protein